MKQSVNEPVPEAFPHLFARYFAATRPAFFAATLAAYLLGLAGAVYSGVVLQEIMAVLALLLALLVHAGVNVLNDYYDALNGTDAANIERLYPFTGGSRFIQNGVLTLTQTAYFGYLLLGVAILGGLALVWQVGLGLLVIGALGVFIGWAYSATPLSLNSRGLGELCVFIGFLGIVIGADYVQRHAFSFQPLIVGVSYALLATNLLFINQFPDRKADAEAGKRNLVVRLPPARTVRIYLTLVIFAIIWLVVMIKIDRLPLLAILSVLPLLFSLRAFWILRQFAATPTQLLPAIRFTLAAVLTHALLLSIVVIWKTL